jgi:hypothetical protein
MVITMEEIAPFATSKIGFMVQFLIHAMNNTPLVDLTFFYAKGGLSRSKQRKLAALLLLKDSDLTESLLGRWLAMLL